MVSKPPLDLHITELIEGHFTECCLSLILSVWVQLWERLVYEGIPVHFSGDWKKKYLRLKSYLATSHGHLTHPLSWSYLYVFMELLRLANCVCSAVLEHGNKWSVLCNALSNIAQYIKRVLCYGRYSLVACQYVPCFILVFWLSCSTGGISVNEKLSKMIWKTKPQKKE